MATQKKIYTSKTYLPELYKWSPNNSIVTKSKTSLGARPFFCDAIAGSQGQDWTTSYVFDLVVVDGQQKHLAYVECGYVE